MRCKDVYKDFNEEEEEEENTTRCLRRLSLSYSSNYSDDNKKMKTCN